MAGQPDSNRSSKSRLVAKKTIGRHFQDYTESTSIHGIQYIGDTTRSIAERCCWIVIITVSIAVCAWMIYAQWKKWELSPVIVSFADTMTPIEDIPFPAITVCSETRSSRQVFNYTHAYLNILNLTEQEKKIFEVVSLTCDILTEDFEGSDIEDNGVLEILKNLTLPVDEMIDDFKFEGESFNVPLSFMPLLTSEGICFTFNMLTAAGFKGAESLSDDEDDPTPDKWNIEEGYTENSGMFVHPGRASGGVHSMLLVNVPGDRDAVCTGGSPGIKVMFHNPAEMPRVKRDFIRVPPGQELTITVKPTAITTSEGLRHYSPENRKCYFTGERQLRHFSLYTQNNCAFECMINNTVNICRCTPFYVPHLEGVPMCRHAERECAYEVETAMTSKRMALRLMGTEDESLLYAVDCNCLPGCFDLQYNLDITQADFDLGFIANTPMERDVTVDFSALSGVKLSNLKVIFRDTQFVTRHRSELYGYTDFFANCGGLLGLFMGFSVLSLVEIVYYCTIRVGCSLFGGGRGSRRNDSDETRSLQMTSPYTGTTSDDIHKGDNDI